ncbi:hypothetical protein M404DRAFT_175389 [Pisolithus tinctorius Marx 270]|uniref:Uncharacterized protein n=1 Tax=Pisolithus tinctorius Marx 270 TaxID=870435 RepID=A0A0C3PY71_PISTI|nr:hypothetical protein M404DRAFT_175389 [Pisolithus tinctorius Marx 270]
MLGPGISVRCLKGCTVCKQVETPIQPCHRTRQKDNVCKITLTYDRSYRLKVVLR